MGTSQSVPEWYPEIAIIRETGWTWEELQNTPTFVIQQYFAVLKAESMAAKEKSRSGTRKA